MRVSIVIPTRERCATLAATLRTCLAITDPDVEILVSDNASKDGTRALIASIADPRLHYVRTPERISQRQNFEHGIAAARGDYVMVIGDDDAVLPCQWPRLRAILQQAAPACLAWPALFYQWPSLEKRAGGGRLKMRRELVFGNAFARAASAQLAAFCPLERRREDLSPKLYHGLVARPVLEALKARTGAYLMSGQIDTYFAAAALAVTRDYHYIRHPFSILAMGPQSGGASIAAQHRDGHANDTARRVAAEATADPVIEPMIMPFPVLGFYFLNGVEQARRLAFAGDLPLDYPAIFAMIIEQLAQTGRGARARGLALLATFCKDIGREAEFAGILAAAERHLADLPEPKPRRALDGGTRRIGLIERLSGASLITPSQIGIDLKPRGLAEVDGAARLADYLLGAEEGAELAPSLQRRAWRAAAARALAVILGRAII